MSRKIVERQEIKTLVARLIPDDVGGGGFTAKLPFGAHLVSVVGYKSTAFNSGGTNPVCTLTLTDGTTVLINAQTLLTTGAITVAVQNKAYPIGGTITGTIAESADTTTLVHATAGDVFVTLGYSIDGASCETQG